MVRVSLFFWSWRVFVQVKVRHHTVTKVPHSSHLQLIILINLVSGER